MSIFHICCRAVSLSVTRRSRGGCTVPLRMTIRCACRSLVPFCVRIVRRSNIVFIVVEYLAVSVGIGKLPHFICDCTVNKLFFLFAARLLRNILIYAVKTEFYPFGKERQIILYRIYPPFVLCRFIGSKAYIQIIHLSHFPFHCQDICRTAPHKRHRLLHRISLFLSFCF